MERTALLKTLLLQFTFSHHFKLLWKRPVWMNLFVCKNCTPFISSGETGLVPVRVLNTSKTSKRCCRIGASWRCTDTETQVRLTKSSKWEGTVGKCYQMHPKNLEVKLKTVDSAATMEKWCILFMSQILADPTWKKHHKETSDTWPIKQQPLCMSSSRNAEI